MDLIKSPLDGIFIPPVFVPNTPYVKDPKGLWFKPGAQLLEPGMLRGADRPSEEYPPDEKFACNTLANSLLINWMKKPGKVMDMYPQYTSLVDAFTNLGKGCTAYTSSEVKADGKEKFDLITFVHTFQKIPAVALNLKKLRSWLNPGGHIFIRMPDFKVKGYERDLTATHYAVANCFWSLDGFLELLSNNPYFTIAQTYEVGPGQRDYILKPIQKKPSICAGIIARNEERDIVKCLKSLEGIVDCVYLVDTGSTDKTIEVAEKTCKEIGIDLKHEIYLDASEQDDKGDWKLWNFSQARNRFVEKIEELKFDYLLWMDSDDIVADRKLKNFIFLDQYIIQGVNIESGNLVWPHHRLWKTGYKIKYSGRCHEYPNYGGLSSTVHEDSVYVKHDAAPSPNTENSNPRNLRILQKEFIEEPTPRCAFYLANTYKDASRWKEAIPVYQKRMDYGRGFEDEYWFAVLYKGRCERSAKMYKEAQLTILKALEEKSNWAEFWMELCYAEYDQGNFRKSLGYALQAMDLPIVPTTLFREKEKYTDQPYRMASWCCEHLGFKELALKFAEDAKTRIGGPDKSWDDRIKTLKSREWWKAEETKTSLKTQFTWHRPGAIGDVLMTLNLVKKFREKYPDCELTYRCHPDTAKILKSTILQTGFDRVETGSTVYGTEINLIGYPLAEGYPYKPMKQHLIGYFAKELGVDPDFDSLALPLPAFPDLKSSEPYATIHPQAGWSQYKNWSMDKWEELCKRLSFEGIPTYQIGGPRDRRVLAAKDHFLNAADTFRASLGALAHATIHIGVDSWTGHATNIKWEGKNRTPAVILWGSTQWDAAGYGHNTNISKGLLCQPCFKESPTISKMSLGLCNNPPGQTYEDPKHDCMAQISVDEVFSAVIKLWDENV
jgi:ADP-heptose:LPS heptosyltransferase/glycosyltransferase involved in cell wall biosynthesis